jgi:Flp pilus assembly protein TadD
MRAYIHASERRRKDAIALLTDIKEQECASPLVCYAIGCLLLLLGRPKRAEKVFLRAIQLMPGNWAAQQQRALALQRLGRFAEAADCLRASLQENFAVAESHNLLGIALATLGDHARSLEAFATARALSPQVVS